MARSDATNASARANLDIGLSAPVPPEEYRRRLYNERLIRFVIPILLAAMAVAAGFSMIQHYISSHTEAVINAQQELKQAAAMKIAMMRLNENLATRSTAPKGTGTSLLEEEVAYTDFVIADAEGRIIESSLDASHSNIASVFSSSPSEGLVSSKVPLALNLSDGSDALVIARPIGSGMTLFAIRSMSSVTGAWWSKMLGLSMLVGSALIALLAVGTAYYMQAMRANNADRICATLSERMQLALTRGRCGIWDWDLHGDRILWSASMFDLLGQRPHEEPLSFADIRSLMHPADVVGFEAVEAAVRDGVTSLDHEFRLLHAEGRWVTLHARADIVRQGNQGMPHLIGFALDVTEQRRLESERRSADLRLRDAIESIPEAFVLWDRDNRLIVCNENYRLFHHVPELSQIIGMRYEDVHAESHGPGPMQVLPIEGEEGAEHNHSYEAELADGRWLQVSERRTKDGGYVSIGTDITARKEQAQKLIDNEQRLLTLLADQQRDRRTLELQALKLSEMARKYREQFQLAQAATRAKSAFLANMSHELRTPLNAIVGFAQVMEQKLFGALGSGRYDDYVLDIRKSGEQMLDMVSDLLHMSKIEAGKTQLSLALIDIAEPVGRAVQALRPKAAAKSIAIKIGAIGGLSAMLDVEASTQILTHLIGNAVKFSRSGSEVTVRARRAPGHLNIFVADRGVGIPSEAIPSLGKAFEQRTHMLENGMKGSGLGLAIATSLASLQGGSVRIRSRVGTGTIVMVSLPCHPRPTMAAKNIEIWSGHLDSPVQLADKAFK